MKRIKDSIKVLLGKAKASSLSTAPEANICPHECPVCSYPVTDFDRLPDYYHEQFDKNGFIFSIFQLETLNWLKYSCPTCGASDRARLYALYFRKNMPFKEGDISLLDIAPDLSLQKFLLNYSEIRYRSADLSLDTVDDRVDITQMDIYNNESFDFVICSHVLEHIENDRQALRELWRILSPGGRGIIMVPIQLCLESDYENPEAQSPEERWKHFGQYDHVRMYSKTGFVSKLKEASFMVHQLDINYFGHEVYQKHGIHPRSVLYVVEKP